MLVAAAPQSVFLDIPTLTFAAVCVTAFLGLLLILTWMQQRDVRALAWWGSAYLIGASAVALWAAPAPWFSVSAEVAEGLIIIACGMIWSGVRLFHGRRLIPGTPFFGVIAWLIMCRLPGIAGDDVLRVSLGIVFVAIYTLLVAFELARERRKSLQSSAATLVVPSLYTAIFLVPLTMRAFLPSIFTTQWLTIFVLEAIILSVGIAFIALLTVKEHHIHFYRKAATTDNLTGLLNRGAFLEGARSLCAVQAKAGAPVTLLMFDLDHFKSINDRFGHAIGDEVLRVFAQTAASSLRANDIVGRLGGEEFAAIVPGPNEVAAIIAERLRAAFEIVGKTVGTHTMGATVSIGTATAVTPVTDIDALIARADGALYDAKHGGRNRVHAAPAEPESVGEVAAAGVIAAEAVAKRPGAKGRIEQPVPSAIGWGATSR